MGDKVFDRPSEVLADRGRVVMDGPDGVSVLLTPDAAVKTSDRLFEAAAEARGQQIMAECEGIRPRRADQGEDPGGA